MKTKQNTSLLFLLTFLTICFLTVKSYAQETFIDSIHFYQKEVKTAFKNLRIEPKKSIKTLYRSKAFYENQKDTINIINCLTRISKAYEINGDIEKSFKSLWEAVFLSKKINNKNLSSDIHRKLALLYDTFNMKDKNLFHLKNALKNAKEIGGKNKSIRMNASYLSLADRECARGNYRLALTYLDSCKLSTLQKDKNYLNVLVEAERGHLMLKTKNYNKAYYHLLKAKNDQEELKVTNKAGILNYLGILKAETQQLDSAVYYYKESLKDIVSKKLPKALKARVMYNLSNAYFTQNKPRKAYQLLLSSKKITDSLMFIKNGSNNELLNIKNTYLEEIKEKDLVLKEQKAALKANKKTQFRLKIILILVVIVFLISSVFFRTKIKLQKVVEEKKETEYKAQLKEKQNQKELEIKNKELTSYALQLIDKDSSIDDLLEIIKTDSPSSYKSLHYKYQKSSKNLWETFNLRFTELNSEFYYKLEQKYPKLSVTEKKHCALIKLNFSTKEIAKILNIELHSVHISRSRIRKKIGMDRSESLEKHISNLY